MDAQTVVSFVRLMREHPQLKGNKKAYKKLIDRVADDTFTLKKQELFNAVKADKKKYMQCYDIYTKFMSENEGDMFNNDIPSDEIVERMLKAFDVKEEENVDNNIEN